MLQFLRVRKATNILHKRQYLPIPATHITHAVLHCEGGGLMPAGRCLPKGTILRRAAHLHDSTSFPRSLISPYRQLPRTATFRCRHATDPRRKMATGAHVPRTHEGLTLSQMERRPAFPIHIRNTSLLKTGLMSSLPALSVTSLHVTKKNPKDRKVVSFKTTHELWRTEQRNYRGLRYL